MTSSSIPTVTLNDDNTMPVLGIGVGELSEADAEQAVLAALSAGYRLIDTAAAYGNEAAVGRAVRKSGVPREEIFVTSKLDVRDQGFKSAQDACRKSVEELGLGYVDLYLIHWPAGEQGKYIDSWGGLMKNKELGDAKSIGVSNFHEEHLSNVIDLSFFTPAVNQIELHPLLNQTELRAVHASHSIVTAAHTPLGTGRLLEHPTITATAAAHGKSSAQVLIRWNIQLGNVVLAGSANSAHMAENLDVFDFDLTSAEMEAINGLDDGTRFRADPAVR